MKSLDQNAVRNWVSANVPYLGSSLLNPGTHGAAPDVPDHIQFLRKRLQNDFDITSFESVPFYNVCRSVFLPMSGVRDFDARRWFGVAAPKLDAHELETRLLEFLSTNVGLTDVEKTACLMGDPFRGRPSSMRQDSLLRLLRSVWLIGPQALLTRLAEVGDIGLLFAEARMGAKPGHPLGIAEVMRVLAMLPGTGLIEKQRVLRSLLLRCGSLEAYCLARLLLSRTGFGRELQRPMITRVLACHYEANETEVERALKLTDIFQLTDVLSQHGPGGLTGIRLKPLSPVRPALASGVTSKLSDDQFPVWVERKYDGVRMLLHRSTEGGRLRAAAFTRNGNDWLERFPGLKSIIRGLAAQDAIIDGELYGVIRHVDGTHPATVQEVMAVYHGDQMPLQLHYTVFDILYLNGQDLTGLPLARRRQILTSLINGLVARRLPIPISTASGQIANCAADVNRLYHHFRSQGHEGVITKDLSSPYLVDTRDPTWLKRKAESTLDLVLIGATYSVTTQSEGLFGSWVVGARNGTLIEDVGDVDGVDRVRDAQICDEIVRRSLITGRQITRTLSMGKRIGMELFPDLVVTVVCQGVAREKDGKWSLRHPRIAAIRADKSPAQADSLEDIAAIAPKARLA